MAPWTIRAHARTVLLDPHRPWDPLRNRLAFVLLISMEMPQPVLQGALRVLVVVRVMPKPQKVQRLMRVLASAQLALMPRLLLMITMVLVRILMMATKVKAVMLQTARRTWRQVLHFKWLAWLASTAPMVLVNVQILTMASKVKAVMLRTARRT